MRTIVRFLPHGFGFSSVRRHSNEVRIQRSRRALAGFGRIRSLPRWPQSARRSIGITAAIWFVTAWPDGSTAVVVAAVLCVLLAPIEEPDKVVQAQVNLRRTRILSPVDGYVTNLLAQLGDYVNVGVNTVSLVDADSFWVDAPWHSRSPKHTARRPSCNNNLPKFGSLYS
jgi:multidrug efflux pump subunit AcrA (membrane-fusion protein)